MADDDRPPADRRRRPAELQTRRPRDRDRGVHHLAPRRCARRSSARCAGSSLSETGGAGTAAAPAARKAWAPSAPVVAHAESSSLRPVGASSRRVTVYFCESLRARERSASSAASRCGDFMRRLRARRALPVLRRGGGGRRADRGRRDREEEAMSSVGGRRPVIHQASLATVIVHAGRLSRFGQRARSVRLGSVRR